jgi:hypothetical protein
MRRIETPLKPSVSAIDSAAAEIFSRVRRPGRSPGCGRNHIKPSEARFDIASVYP